MAQIVAYDVKSTRTHRFVDGRKSASQRHLSQPRSHAQRTRCATVEL